MQQRRHVIIAYTTIMIFTILAIGVSLSIGSVSISISNVVKILSSHLLPVTLEQTWSNSVDNIIWQIRAPRVMLAFLVGASLSLAGAAFQGLLRNPLADPYTLGVSSGASLGAVIAISVPLSIPFFGIYSLPFFALIGALLSLVLVFGLARIGNRMIIETLILSGIIISSFLGAFISLVIALSSKELVQIIYWLMGSVAMRNWGHVLALFPVLIAVFILLFWKSKELNILSFGEDTARFLGVNVEGSRNLILFSASLLTAVAVSVSGVVGFVGLIIPHLVRLVVGPRHEHLLPLALLAGGIYLVLADTIARTIIAPSELPLGVITALIGAPVFAYLLYKRDRGFNRGGSV